MNRTTAVFRNLHVLGKIVPDIRDVVKFDTLRSYQDHICTADVIICNYINHHYYPVATCIIQGLKNGWRDKFPKNFHPQSLQQVFDIHLGLALVSKSIIPYFYRIHQLMRKY